jgi:hypothetical protein
MSATPPVTPAPAGTLEQRIETKLRSWGRMGVWLGIAIAALAVVYLLAPQMVKVSLYKLSLLPAAVYVLYWIDRALNEKRPHEYFEEAERCEDEAAAVPGGMDTPGYHALMHRAEVMRDYGHDRMMRRTLLIAAGMIAVALGS